MRSIALVLLLTLFAPTSYSNSYLGLSTSLRVQNDSSGLGTNHSSVHALVGGYAWKNWGITAELSENRTESGSGVTLVQLVERELVVGLRKTLSLTYWRPFVSAGFSLIAPKVGTHFAGTVINNDGQTKQALYLSTGIQSDLKRSLNMGLEFRYFKGLGENQVTRSDHLVRFIYQL